MWVLFLAQFFETLEADRLISAALRPIAIVCVTFFPSFHDVLSMMRPEGRGVGLGDITNGFADGGVGVGVLIVVACVFSNALKPFQ